MAQYRTPYVLGFLAVLGGLLLLAFTQVSVVLPDRSRAELANLQEGGVISEATGVVFAGLLITIGALFILANASPAPLLRKTIALSVVGVALPIFFVLQTLLVINGVSADLGDERYVYFSASYLFQSGEALSFAAVYILFLFTLLLVFLLLGSTAYLLAPRRVTKAILDAASWAKNEAVHIAATLFLLLSLSVLFYYLLRLAIATNAADLRNQGLLGTMLLPVYYLLAFLLFALALSVAAHAFLLNWGTQAPLEFHRLVMNIRTIARVERALLVAAATLNLLVIISPQLPSKLPLSQSFAFGVSPRGLSYALYLLLLPYVPYAVTTRRLDFLLRAGKGPATNAPFAERSLRMVLAHVLGLVLITALSAAIGWQPLSLMLAMSGWTAGVLLWNAVRVETPTGLPRLAFRGEAGPAFYFVFLGLAVTTGLMLWGSGNTYEVTVASLGNVESLDVSNQSDVGADVFARVAAAALIVGSLILTLDLWLNAYRIERRFLGHYLGVFLSTSLVMLLVFTVGVWTEDTGNAYAGFAFHQYYALEQTGAGLLLAGTVVYVAYAITRIVRPILEHGRNAPTAPAVSVRWN